MALTLTLEPKNFFIETAIAGVSANTGATSPGTMADDASVGTEAWFSVNSAKTSNNGYAGTAGGLPAGEIMHYLKASNFGFSVPSGATIDGILVEIEQKNAFGAVTVENAVRIVKSGSIGTTNKSTGATLPATDTYVSYGSSSDLWGETWTAEDINLTTFGAVFSVTNTGVDISIPNVDHIRITVYYTTGGTPVTYSLEQKPSGGTFGSSPGRTFADGGTFGEPATYLTLEPKTTISLTLEEKPV